MLERARLARPRRRSRSRRASTRYRDYIGGSRGEFTVAKDQNVRLRTRLVQRPQRDLPRRRPAGDHPGHRLRQRPADGRGAVRLRLARRGAGRKRGDRRRLHAPRERRSRDRSASTSATKRCCGRCSSNSASSRSGQGHGARARSFPPRCRLHPVSRRPTKLARATVEAAQRNPLPALRGAGGARTRQRQRRRRHPRQPRLHPALPRERARPHVRPRLRADRRRQRLDRRHPPATSPGWPSATPASGSWSTAPTSASRPPATRASAWRPATTWSC